jgi:hypothetical protein
MQDEQMKRIKRRAKPAAANICPDETADACGQAGRASTQMIAAKNR